jgi:hypothetical protein
VRATRPPIKIAENFLQKFSAIFFSHPIIFVNFAPKNKADYKNAVDNPRQTSGDRAVEEGKHIRY